MFRITWQRVPRHNLAPGPGDTARFLFVTRRGKALANRQGLAAYRHASLFPKNLVHPLIAQKVYPAFLRGEYDTAIFQALREVEVAVCEAGGYAQSIVRLCCNRRATHRVPGFFELMIRRSRVRILAGPLDFKGPTPLSRVRNLLEYREFLRIPATSPQDGPVRSPQQQPKTPVLDKMSH